MVNFEVKLRGECESVALHQVQGLRVDQVKSSTKVSPSSVCAGWRTEGMFETSDATGSLRRVTEKSKF